MHAERRAVIDIGTNSVKLLVADVLNNSVSPAEEKSHQTRLGQGFYETQCLQPERIRETAQTVADFAKEARQHGAEKIRIIATSAAREARNADELRQAILQTSGLTVEIISGEDEAEFAFQGINTDETLSGFPVLLLEVGGGSTQCIVGQSGHSHYLRSFPIGSVRITEKLPHSDPPTSEELKKCRDWLSEFLKTEAGAQLQPVLERERRAVGKDKTFQLVGTGGTASILGCMEAQLDHFDRNRLESTRLTAARIQWHVQHLWSMPLMQRKEIIGLPKNRADIILNGAAIYEAVMKEFGFDCLRISTRGLRFGAVLPRNSASKKRSAASDSTLQRNESRLWAQ